MSNIDVFTNERFRLLSYLYDIKGKDNLVKITQTELVSELGISRGSINSIFKFLRNFGYLIHDDTRIGRYYLTLEALNVVETFRKSDDDFADK